MIAAQIPPELANQIAMQASIGSRSFRTGTVGAKLARAVRGICFIPGQSFGELNRTENKEMLIERPVGVAFREDGRMTARLLHNLMR